MKLKLKETNALETLASLFHQLPHTEVGHWNLHHLPIAKEVISKINPTSILEIGFNCGHSALTWLTQSQATLLSIDHGNLPSTEIARQFVSSQFPNRFSLLYSDSRSAHPFLFEKNFDLLFIDGGHSYDISLNDLTFAILLNIPYILLDDALLPRTQSALSDFQKLHPFITLHNWDIHNGIIFFQNPLALPPTMC